jgi:hypothetical protein
MNEQDKIAIIKKWYAEGKIKPLGHNCYSVPSESFGYGITPRLVRQVVSELMIQKELSDTFDRLLKEHGDNHKNRLLVANYTLGYMGASFGLHVK